MTGRIASINVSAGGVPKRPVRSARVTSLGLMGDSHRDTAHHGGPERALCLFAIELIDALTSEGHPIAPGAIGENITVEGIPWETVAPGARYRLGDRVVIEVTTYTSPCHKIQGSFLGNQQSRVSQTRHPGWSRVYARVLTAGEIHRGDVVAPLPRAENSR
jgi:MOSC domain-containing protein YiiM